MGCQRSEIARKAAQERVEILRDAEPNSWLALSHDESSVVASGQDYVQAVEKAKEKGEDDPVLIKIPQQWNAMVL